MYFLKPDGKKTQVECFRVSKSDCLDILAEDFKERFGPESELRRRDAGIVLTGPTEIRVVNGRTETTSVIPMVLRQEGNWLLQSDDEYLLDLQFPSELLTRLNQLNNFDWYFESRPGDVPIRERSMMLQSVFARLGVMRQRRDDE